MLTLGLDPSAVLTWAGRREPSRVEAALRGNAASGDAAFLHAAAAMMKQ